MKSCVVSFDHLFKDLRYEILRCMFLSNLGRLTQRIVGPLGPSDEIDRVSTSDNSTPSGAN